MKENFERSYKLIRASEGGNDDDPDDHGGRTSRGVTQREYSAWRKENGFPDADVWKMSEIECETIYHNEYWNPWCDLLPIGVDYLHFDFSITSGPHQSILILQRAVGVVADGRIGPVTRQAITAANAESFVSRFCEKKADYYRSLHQPKFTRGWLNRVAFTKTEALKMVRDNAKLN